MAPGEPDHHGDGEKNVPYRRGLTGVEAELKTTDMQPVQVPRVVVRAVAHQEVNNLRVHRAYLQ